MTIRTRLRPALLASAMGLAPLIGCIGASDDKLGSGYNAGTGGGAINDGEGIKSGTQQAREDKGDNPGAGTGTGRPQSTNETRTGGLGGARDDTPEGPGATGPRTSSGVASGPK